MILERKKCVYGSQFSVKYNIFRSLMNGTATTVNAKVQFLSVFLVEPSSFCPDKKRLDRNESLLHMYTNSGNEKRRLMRKGEWEYRVYNLFNNGAHKLAEYFSKSVSSTSPIWELGFQIYELRVRKQRQRLGQSALKRGSAMTKRS